MCPPHEWNNKQRGNGFHNNVLARIYGKIKGVRRTALFFFFFWYSTTQIYVATALINAISPFLNCNNNLSHLYSSFWETLVAQERKTTVLK